MLPCNVIVQQRAEGEVEIAAVDPVASMQAIENPELRDVAEQGIWPGRRACWKTFSTLWGLRPTRSSPYPDRSSIRCSLYRPWL